MTRARIAGALLLVLLGAGLLIRVTNRAGAPPKNPASVPLEVRAVESQPGKPGTDGTFSTVGGPPVAALERWGSKRKLLRC